MFPALLCRYTSNKRAWQIEIFVFDDCCCRSSKHSSYRSDHERSRHSSQHHMHSPAHSTGRSPDNNVVLRESPATSPRTRHVMSPGISARTRHGTVYRSRSPDEYKKSRDDLVNWTIESDYDVSQQQHAVSMVLPSLLFSLFNLPAFFLHMKS